MHGRSFSNGTLAVASILLLCGLGALGAPLIKNFFWPMVAFECPASGTVFTFNVSAPKTERLDKIKMRMTGREGFVCRVHADASGDYGWIGGLAPDNDDWHKANRCPAYQIWPMRVGNRGEYYYEWPDGRWASGEYEVVEYGWLRVPAGLFHVFKVVQTTATRRGETITTHWWSPQLKWIVKQESNDPMVGDWELAGIAEPPAN